MTSKFTTSALIPSSGIYIIETFHPHGYQASVYDTNGLTSLGRWFKTIEAADRYASELKLGIEHGP